MPLDTAPLSPVRRIIAIAVLGVILGGSLVLAQALVVYRQKNPVPVQTQQVERDPEEIWNDGIKITISQPPTLRVSALIRDPWRITSVDDGGNPDGWLITLPSGRWKMARMDGFMEATGAEQRFNRLADMAAKATVSLRSDFHTFESRDRLDFGPTKAELFVGVVGREGAAKQEVTLTAAVAVGDHGLTLAFAADSADKKPITPAEEAVFRDICKHARIGSGSLQIGAPATSRPVPPVATRPE